MLDANLDALEAEAELKAGVADDRVYDVVLRATGSEWRASEAFQARVADRLRRNEKPEV